LVGQTSLRDSRLTKRPLAAAPPITGASMIDHEQIADLEKKLLIASSQAHSLHGADHEDEYRQASARVASLDLELSERISQARPPSAQHFPALSCFRHLNRSTVAATDGNVGRVTAVLFDDMSWVIRYLVVDTETWLSGRQVLISPYSVRQPLDSGRRIEVALTSEQVRNSPDIDTHQPVSRGREREFMAHYSYPAYWEGARLWGVGDYPLMPPSLPAETQGVAGLAGDGSTADEERFHLRSSERVLGYIVQASDGSIGHVRDFIFDHESWAIRYLVVDSGNWWQGSQKVLVATRWIDRIEWAASSVHINLTRQQIRESPQYPVAEHLTRAYEKLLHDEYKKPGYRE
jgi:hypothetical protein